MHTITYYKNDSSFAVQNIYLVFVSIEVNSTGGNGKHIARKMYIRIERTFIPLIQKKIHEIICSNI